MIARITAVYGLSVPGKQLATSVGSLILAGGATTAGRWLVASALRFVPGGQIPAMAISGAVAASLTTAMGWAWVAVCDRLLADPEMVDSPELKAVFNEEFKKRYRLSSSRQKAS